MESVFWTSPGQSSRSTATPCLFTSTLSAVDFDRLPRRVLRVPTRLSMARGELVLVKRRRVPRRTRAIRPSAIFRHLTRSRASPSLCFTGTSASASCTRFAPLQPLPTCPTATRPAGPSSRTIDDRGRPDAARHELRGERCVALLQRRHQAGTDRRRAARAESCATCSQPHPLSSQPHPRLHRVQR